MVNVREGLKKPHDFLRSRETGPQPCITKKHSIVTSLIAFKLNIFTDSKHYRFPQNFHRYQKSKALKDFLLNINLNMQRVSPPPPIFSSVDKNSIQKNI